MIEFSDPFPFGGCPYDDAEIFRFDALNQLPQTRALFIRFDFCGNRYFVGKGYQDDVSSCERQFGGQPRAFGRNRLFGDLDQHLLPYFERIADASLFFNFREYLLFRHGRDFLFSQRLLQKFLLCVKVRT